MGEGLQGELADYVECKAQRILFQLKHISLHCGIAKQLAEDGDFIRNRWCKPRNLAGSKDRVEEGTPLLPGTSMHRHQGRPAHDDFHGVSHSSRFVEKGSLNLGRRIRIGDNHESLVKWPKIEVEDTLEELVR